MFYGFVTLRVSLESVVSGASARAAFVEKRSSRSDTKKRTSAHRRTRTIRLRSRARRIGRSRLRVWDVPGGGRSNARAALVDDSMPVARSAAPAPNARRVTRGATESDRCEMGSAHLVMCDRRDAERDAERRDGAARATPPPATQREKAIDAMGRNVRTGREARLGVVRGDERSKKIQVAAAQHEISITPALRLCDRTVCESNPVPPSVSTRIRASLAQCITITIITTETHHDNTIQKTLLFLSARNTSPHFFVVVPPLHGRRVQLVSASRERFSKRRVPRDGFC